MENDNMKDTVDVDVPKKNIVEDKILDKDTSQDLEDGVKSDESMKIFDSRDDIYANFDKRKREELNLENPKDVSDQELSDKDSDDQNDDDAGDQDDPMVELKVYGQKIYKPKSEVDAHGGKAAYQKELAAAEKAEIERERREIEEEKKRIAQEREALEARRKSVPSQDEPPKKTDLPVDDQADETEIRAKILAASESLFDGDIERFTNDILNVIDRKKGSGQSIDIDAIVERTVQQTRETMTREQKVKELTEARQVFTSEYPELIADDELFHEVDSRTVYLQQRYPDKAPLEILRLAGTEVRKLYGTEKNVNSDPDDLRRRQAKIEEKRSLQKPHGGSDRSPKKPEPKQQTRSDYVKQLQANRGQMI